MKIKNYKLLGLIFMGVVLAPQAVFARGGSLSQLTAVDTSEQQAALDQKLADVFTDLYDSSQKYFDEFSKRYISKGSFLSVFLVCSDFFCNQCASCS